jgi:hypothetical protein
MTETIEQAAENHWKMTYVMALDDSTKPYIIEDFKAGATWQLSQPNPHRIKVAHVLELLEMHHDEKISFSRMVEILNEIAAGKHKERIEI